MSYSGRAYFLEVAPQGSSQPTLDARLFSTRSSAVISSREDIWIESSIGQLNTPRKTRSLHDIATERGKGKINEDGCIVSVLTTTYEAEDERNWTDS